MIITVEFSGENKSGKSTIAQLIRDTLLSHGVNVELHDHDHPEELPNLQGRIESIKRMGVKVVLKPTNRATKCCDEKLHEVQNIQCVPV